MRLGAPNPGELPNYEQERLDHIVIWYARNIRPENSEQPIVIDARKVLLGYCLDVSGAKLTVNTES